MAAGGHWAGMLARSHRPLRRTSQAEEGAKEPRCGSASEGSCRCGTLPKGGHKGRPCKVDNKSVIETEREKNSLKIRERSGNIYENKESSFHRPERTGNVIENKGSYTSDAGMSLKIKQVIRYSRELFSPPAGTNQRHPVRPVTRGCGSRGASTNSRPSISPTWEEEQCETCP
jgi:hypothetical protein